MTFAIRLLDIDSDDDLLGAHEVDSLVDEMLIGACDIRTAAHLREASRDTPYTHHRRLLAVDDAGHVVGTSYLALPQAENTGMAEVYWVVRPDRMRRGIGTALAEASADLATAEGRSKLTVWATIPAVGDPDDASFANNRIATRLGLTRRNLAVCRVGSLPIDADAVARLQAEATDRPGNGDYRIVTWRDRAPEEHLLDVCRLARQLEIDDPTEDIEYEVPEFTPERVRHSEERSIEAGRTRLVSAAVAPDGHLAAYSLVDWVRDGARTAWQGNTLVMPEHRGHGLGLSLKLRTHTRLTRDAPGIRTVTTWNSHVNPWMIGINEALGYRPRFREICYQN